MSNLLVVETPVLSPGRCFRCSGYQGPLIDFGIDNWEGRIYLCFTCVDGVIPLRGGATPEQVARYEALLSDAHEKIEELKAQRVEARREFVAEVADKMLERKAVA